MTSKHGFFAQKKQPLLAEDIVWAWIDQNKPWWPAQVLTYDNTTNTVGVNVLRPRKRKKHKYYLLNLKNIRKWDDLSYQQVINEFVRRKGYQNSGQIPEELWSQWHGIRGKQLSALDEAESEIERIHEVRRMKAERVTERLEWEATEKEQKQREDQLLQYVGQVYDGRRRNQGHVLLENALTKMDIDEETKETEIVCTDPSLVELERNMTQTISKFHEKVNQLQSLIDIESDVADDADNILPDDVANSNVGLGFNVHTSVRQDVQA
eukprot:68143_1